MPQEKLRRDDVPELGELDLALFRELGMDGRTSHADLAKAVGWSESTVRRQMDQLRESGTLLYDLELDLAAFGFRASTWLWLSVPPSELAATGAAFGEFPEVAYAAAVTGAFNLLACAVCRDEEEFYDFLTTRVGSLRAVEPSRDLPDHPHSEAILDGACRRITSRPSLVLPMIIWCQVTLSTNMFIYRPRRLGGGPLAGQGNSQSERSGP